jgi:hypothetical protein
VESVLGWFGKAICESDVAISDGSIEKKRDWGMHKKTTNNGKPA